MAKDTDKKVAEKKIKKAKQPKQGDRLGCLIKIIIVVLLLLAGALVYLQLNMQQAINEIVPERGTEENSYLTGRMNVLVVGTDAEAHDAGRADSIIVFNVDLDNKHVNALSIPRDSRVEIPGYQNKTKINHSYAYGGIELTKQTVENLLGVPIDYYAVTNFAGFEDIVETLGGVYIDVPIRMKTHTWYGDIDLQPGYQLLDAKQALGFVRYRYDAGGDISRGKRQQMFLKAVFNRVTEPGNIPKLPQLIPQILDCVETDLSYTSLLALVNYFSDVNLDIAFTSESLAGHSQTISGGSYWIIDEEAMPETIDRIFYQDPEPPPSPEEIINNAVTTAIDREIGSKRPGANKRPAAGVYSSRSDTALR